MNYQHIALQLWHDGTTSPAGYVASVIRWAQESKAPLDAIYNEGSGMTPSWALIEGVTNTDRLRNMLQRANSLRDNRSEEMLAVIHILEDRIMRNEENEELIEEGKSTMWELVYSEMTDLANAVSNEDRLIYMSVDQVERRLEGLKATYPDIWSEVAEAEYMRRHDL